MKISRCDVHCNTYALPRLRFEAQQLTSFAGLVLIQRLMGLLDMKRRVFTCLAHLNHGQIFKTGHVFLQLLLHLMLGFRDLREVSYYRHDPMVKRLLGLNQLPDAATLCRQLQRMDERAIQRLRELMRRLVLERLGLLVLPRVTIEFDGFVQSTARKAEGTAIGYNPKKKGRRSYYPLIASIAQTQQVLDLLHRSGNVHDSRGAHDFILACVRHVRAVLPHAVIEVRMDGAFFSDEIVQALHAIGVGFTISVPFERFPNLKQMIEDRQWWYRLDDGRWGFEVRWKPKSWSRQHRFVVVCMEKEVPQKGPLQLDLFEPVDREYQYKVIVTNKDVGLKAVTSFHDGRGQQENMFGQMSSHCHTQHVPVRHRRGNEAYLIAGCMAHNLLHELQMRTETRQRHTNTPRTPLWAFLTPQTWRNRWLHRAGRLTRPAGQLTLTISGDRQIEAMLNQMLDHMDETRPAA